MGRVKAYMMEIQELIFEALEKGLRDDQEICDYVLKRFPVATRIDIYSELNKITRQFYA